MEKQTVYKLDSKGKQRVWSIWTISSGDGSASIEIESGLVNGKKVRESIPITEGKNIGKSNQRTPYEQAVSQAEAKLELKLRGEYSRELDNASQGTLRSGIPSPMLAQKYHPTGKQKGSKTLEKMRLVGKGIHVQPKLDGNRCLIKVDDFGAVMHTRKGDVMPVQLNHILTDIQEAYKKLNQNPSGSFKVLKELVLDGELFSNALTFNELNGHLKRKDSQDPETLVKIKFHLYDIMHEEPYFMRYENLKYFASDTVEIVPSYEIIATDENLQEYLEQFLSEGHEGLMIRTLDSGYKNKRDWSLVKVKIFEDEEFKVLDLEEDSMGRLGKFIMEMDAPTVDHDGKLVTTFKAGVTGIDHETGRQMLLEKDRYIGKMATIEFFGRDIRPRFPKFKGIRD